MRGALDALDHAFHGVLIVWKWVGGVRAEGEPRTPEFAAIWLGAELSGRLGSFSSSLSLAIRATQQSKT